VCSVVPSSVPLSYAVIVGNGSNKKRRKGLSVVDHVQRLSWIWFMNNTAKVPFLLYEWIWNPGDCMLR
jgi:hypothetical protein